MRVDFAATVPKSPDSEELNEDRYLFSLDGSVATLSDGASESYNSQKWAEILCGLACEQGELSMELVVEGVRKYAELNDPSQLSWSKAAAFERGSFATLLMLRHDRERCDIEIVAVGDTVLLLLEGPELVLKFPLNSAEDFAAKPELLSTRADLNGFVQDALFNTKHVAVRPAGEHTTALLLTDALGEWCYQAMESGRNDWRTLATVGSDEEFRTLVLEARAQHQMRVDDTTLVRLKF